MRARVITLSLLAVLLFVLGGLVLVDRLLARQDLDNAEADAELSAEVLGEYVRMHVVALAAFHGVLAEGDAAARDRERFLGAVGTLNATGGAARGFRRVWIADTAGVVINEYVFGGPSRIGLGGTDLDTVRDFALGEAMATVRRTRRPFITRSDTLYSGRRGVLVVRPIVVGERIAGFACGSIRGDAFVGALPGTRVAERGDTHLLDAAGMLWPDEPAADTAVDAPIVLRERVDVPGLAPWTLVVGYEAPNASLRALTWVLGLSVMAVLARTLLHERRQAIRMADRSSELERLSGELLAANRAKSEFLANISHELRTPLNAIVGFADLLREGVYGELNARQTGPVQRIEASATHLRQLVDQILDLAKITAGRLEVHVEPIDLRPFVLDVASEVEPLINEKGLSLSIAVGATLPRVRTDPSHLRQILVNLIGNAVKYTPQGAVAVRARRVAVTEKLPTRDGVGMSPPTPVMRGDGAPVTSGWIALQVVDTGVGIPPDDRERVFEEFEQVNAGPRGDSARRGTGLGLPISRRLARLLGGDVSVDSELGRGSTFTLWIPVEG
jgi:signal transduction histidine kinase